LSSELEFGLKCFTRAGRAMLFHSDDYSAAFSALSLAVVCWNGIRQSHVNLSNQGHNLIGDHACAEAFDALLLLPDCASKLIIPESEDVDVDGNDWNRASSERVIIQLQRLEDFVDDQLADPDVTESTQGQNGPAKMLFAVQHYLPSLARIGYKVSCSFYIRSPLCATTCRSILIRLFCHQHGNRLARLQDYISSQEALRISLTATDKCLARIRQEMNNTSDTTTQDDRSMHASQIQEQEMLVVSKQSFHILSHVCRSMNKYEEANKCLDRIEIYIDEQRKHDDELYNKTMNQLAARDKSTSLHHSSSTFALEGKLLELRH